MRIIGNGGHAKVIRSFVDDLQISGMFDGTFIAVGDNESRRKEADAHYSAGDFIGYLRHPAASINRPKSIGVGTVIMAGAVIQPDCVIGKHVIINTSASVDHDCIIEDYVHIAPGCHLCGNVTVGEGAFLGAGTIVIPGITISPWKKIRAGSVITEDI